jgi:hypothetical protein
MDHQQRYVRASEQVPGCAACEPFNQLVVPIRSRHQHIRSGLMGFRQELMAKC